MQELKQTGSTSCSVKTDKLTVEKLEAELFQNIGASQIALMASFELYLKTMFFVINSTHVTIKPFHKSVIRKLEDIVFGRSKKRNLALNIPVGSGKSLLIEYFISWCFARNINNAFIYISHSDRLINKLSKETKEIVEHTTWTKIFGEKLAPDSKSKVNWIFEGGKNRTGLTAGTMGGGITGLDAGNPIVEGFSGALIIDDPMDVSKARYETARQEVIDHYTNKLATRRRTPTTPTILVMQRIHLEDLTGYLQANEEDDWDFVTIPAIEEDKEESFWPERYPIKDILKIKEVNSFLYWGQYQQRPIAAGGNVIKSEWFQYYPLSLFDSVKFDRLFMTADTAQKKKEHNDWTVFGYWGVFQRKLYLLDLIRGKWEAPDLKKEAKKFWSKHRLGINGRLPNCVYIEDKSSGTSLIQELQREAGFPVIAVERHKDKLTRVEDGISHIEAGYVLLPVDPSYGFNPKFLSECEAFARDDSHKFDDQVDVLMDGIKIGLAQVGLSSVFIV